MKPRHALVPTLLALACLSAPAFAQGKPAAPERIYVPIEDFDRIFDREKGGVFIPYKDLRRLLERANAQPKRTTPKVPVAPPADYVLVGATFDGVAGERVARFKATFEIEVLRDNAWVVIPIGLGEASLEDVQANGGRAVVGPLSQLLPLVPSEGKPAAAQRGYGIVVRGAGRVKTTATFAVPISSKAGESTFKLKLPGAALTRFEVVLPESGVKVKVDNSLATEETKGEGDRARVRAYFGSAADATVTWNPKPKSVEGEVLAPLVFAHAGTSLRLGAGLLRSITTIRYEISQAPCGEFKLRFPKGYRFVGVKGEDMSDYTQPKLVDGEQEITVRLYEKAAKDYQLRLELERTIADGVKRVAFPWVRTIGTEREDGVLAVRASEFVSMEPAGLKGLNQIDLKNLPQELATDLGWDAEKKDNTVRPPLAFEYTLQPYALDVLTRPIESEVKGQVSCLATVRDDEVALKARIRYTVRKRGIFQVRVKIPRGLNLAPFDDAQVKGHEVTDDPDDKTASILTVRFVNLRPHDKSFWLSVAGTLERAEKQPETGEVALALPRIGLLDVQEEKGFLGVAGQTHLKLTYEREASGKNLLPLSIIKLGQQVSFKKTLRPEGGESLTFGLRYSWTKDVNARFTVKKRESKVTAAVETLVDAQEDLVKVTSTVKFKVEHAGVEQVRLKVPKDLAAEKDFKLKSELIKDKKVVIEGDHAIWTVALQGKQLGEFALICEYDIKLEGFQAGQQRKVMVRELEVLDCFDENGDIALKKHENLVIREAELTGLEKRDKRELPAALQSQAIHGYHYAGHPHTLALSLTKYDFQAPLGILVKHLHLDEVLDPDGLLKVEAWLELQNNAEQFLTVLLPEGATMRGLQVDGANKEWSEGNLVEARPSVQVHLGEVTKTRKQAPFLVRLRYDLAPAELGSRGDRTFTGPAFPLKDERSVPVARLTRDLYLPDGYAYLEFDTDSTKHFDETSLWESLKLALGVRTGRERQARERTAGFARNRVVSLKATRTFSSGGSGIYPFLEIPQGREPFLFEKLANPSKLEVSYSTWPLFFLFDVLVFLGVVLLGVFLHLRNLVRPVVFVSVTAALSLLGAVFLGRAMEPYFASGLVGSAGLGGFFLLRGLWRELTVLRHERRLSELVEEAAVARARADAAEREAALQGVVSARPRTADAAATPESSGKGEAKASGKVESSAAEVAAAEKIQLEVAAPEVTESASAPDAADASAGSAEQSETKGESASSDDAPSDEGGKAE